jgi:hypothetical protein
MCNQTQSTGNNARIIEYTPFNKTKKLTTQTTNGTEVNETTYDANNNRIIQKAYHDTSTSVCFPLSFISLLIFYFVN